MKPDIHPTLHPVVFVDGDHEIITRSTKMSAETREIDGVEHYVIPIDISAFTHPFFTGKQRLIDTEGRVERFRRKFGARGGAGAGSAPAPDNDAPSAAAGDAGGAADSDAGSAADSDGGSSE